MLIWSYAPLSGAWGPFFVGLAPREPRGILHVGTRRVIRFARIYLEILSTSIDLLFVQKQSSVEVSA